jgi:hypothetical protein
MTASAAIDKHPIQVIHPGVLKSKTASEMRSAPAASTKCVTISTPPGKSISDSTAAGSSDKKTMAAKKPRGDLIVYSDSISFLAICRIFSRTSS